MAERDGSRDFDWAIGRWSIRLKRLLRPLTGSSEWIDLEGHSVCRPIWDGSAQLDELVTVNPADGTRVEGLTLRTYNPETREWRLYWANRRNGLIGTPQVGRFVDGRGEFLDRDTFNGKPILIRYVWSQTSTPSPHFEQSFSNDDGKSWETNWVTDQTRVPDEGGTKKGPSA
jgi:hypothetical protein